MFAFGHDAGLQFDLLLQHLAEGADARLVEMLTRRVGPSADIVGHDGHGDQLGMGVDQ